MDAVSQMMRMAENLEVGRLVGQQHRYGRWQDPTDAVAGVNVERSNGGSPRGLVSVVVMSGKERMGSDSSV
jgi:hypothetical protein